VDQRRCRLFAISTEGCGIPVRAVVPMAGTDPDIRSRRYL